MTACSSSTVTLGRAAHPAADVSFEEGPAHQQALPADGEAHPVAAELVAQALRGNVGGDGAVRDQFLGYTREQPGHDHEPPRQKGVRVAGLRDALAVLVALGESVSLDDRHPLEVIREHAGRQTARPCCPRSRRRGPSCRTKLGFRWQPCVFLSSLCLGSEEEMSRWTTPPSWRSFDRAYAADA